MPRLPGTSAARRASDTSGKADEGGEAALEAPKPEKPAEAPKPAVSPWKMAVEQALRAAQNSVDTADEVIEQLVQEAPVSEETVAMPEAAPGGSVRSRGDGRGRIRRGC